jgi:hypothetical protein
MTQRGDAIAVEGDACPDELYDPEGPRSRQEPVGAREQAAAAEQQDEAAAASFEGVHEHHERDGTRPERSEHAASLTVWLLAGGALWR